MATLDDLAFEAERDIGTVQAFFPILPALGNRWAGRRPWEGRTIGFNVHVTPLTASLLQEIALGGATCVVSAANPATTDAGTVGLLRNNGIEVYTGGDLEDRHRQVLSHQPVWLVDTGFALIRSALDRPEGARGILGAIETTRSGITRLRDRERAGIAVVNAHDGRLRDAIQNRSGVGAAIWEAVTQLTGMHPAGRAVVVIGYGPVGKGVADWARANGVAVEIVDQDPVRRLYAHYDGYPTPSLADALGRVQIAVTATGRKGAVSVEALANARERLVLLNAGTGGDEIDVPGIRRSAERVDHIADGVVQYRFESGRSVIVLGDGHPLNIVLSSGSPEPVLLQFALIGLVLEWLASQRLTHGEHAVPASIEEEVARHALRALSVPD